MELLPFQERNGTQSAPGRAHKGNKGLLNYGASAGFFSPPRAPQALRAVRALLLVSLRLEKPVARLAAWRERQSRLSYGGAAPFFSKPANLTGVH